MTPNDVRRCLMMSDVVDYADDDGDDDDDDDAC